MLKEMLRDMYKDIRVDSTICSFDSRDVHEVIIFPRKGTNRAQRVNIDCKKGENERKER